VSAVLRIERLEAAYGTQPVLHGIDLEIAAGEVATLLGRNGMGKTTTVRSIFGLTRTRGRIELLGERIDGLAADHVARRGVGWVPEGRAIFPNLTVRENLVAFCANRNSSADPWTLDKVFALFPELAARARNLGAELSGGEQQMLAIGRALMTNPHLLILDEASEGLAPLVRDEIWRCLQRLRAAGQTLLVIDKHVDRLVALADHHTIVERGRSVWHGSSRDLSNDAALWHRYLGI
jgi:branched-chain amino acid transport system ATP-binding protein